jgi:hypothetical protein
MKILHRILRRHAAAALAVLICIAAPALASAQYYEYDVSGNITKIQAVDANYDDIGGFDYSKLTAVGIIIGAPGSATSWIDSLEPDVPETPVDAPTTGVYLNANPEIRLGAGATEFVANGFTLNNGIAVLDDRPAGSECLGLPVHDVFGFGGSFPGVQTGPSWLSVDSGTGPPSGCNLVDPSQKGVAIFLASILTVPGALTSTALPSSLTLADFNIAKLMVLNMLDTDTGQRYVIDVTIDTLTIDTDFQAPSVPLMGRAAMIVLVALLSVGSLVVIRRPSQTLA